MRVLVDVLIPVHNAAETIQETVKSALEQSIPNYLRNESRNGTESHVHDSYSRISLKEVHIDIAICCQDDGSEDDSLKILKNIQRSLLTKSTTLQEGTVHECDRHELTYQLFIGSDRNAGAGAARNRASFLRSKMNPTPNHLSDTSLYFICLLDSDDIMHPHRIAHQVAVMLALSKEDRNSTLLGSNFNRIPANSTWHYTEWANALTDERLILEKFREITILQPTWMMTKARFKQLGGYIEASHLDQLVSKSKEKIDCQAYKLVHPRYDTPQTLRLAEDLRLFYAHLSYPYLVKGNAAMNDSASNIAPGKLKMIRTKEPLLTYRHREGQSQSSSTSRKLLLQLRVKAFEDLILCNKSRMKTSWLSTVESEGFIIWGAGRDGKAFFKSLGDDVKKCVRCFVDVDEKKISNGYYVVPKDKACSANVSRPKVKECFKVPIIHFSLIASGCEARKELMNEWIHNQHEDNDIVAGRITKNRKKQCKPLKKRQKTEGEPKRILHAISKKDKENMEMIETGVLTKLPVVVCVAMYRTNGVLEKNVEKIGRCEGVDLWHFS